MLGGVTVYLTVWNIIIWKIRNDISWRMREGAIFFNPVYELIQKYWVLSMSLSKWCSLRSKRQLPLHWTKFLKPTISNFPKSYTCLPPPPIPPLNILHKQRFQVYFGTRRNWKIFMLKKKFGTQTNCIKGSSNRYTLKWINGMAWRESVTAILLVTINTN